MKKQFCTIIIFLLVLITVQAYGQDWPHNTANGADCDFCHFIYGTEPSLLPPWTAHEPQNIDDTQFNGLCRSCHNDIDAPFVNTHSSLQTDNSYGDWSIQCKVCHNPHGHFQIRTYGSESYLHEGISTTVTSTAITRTGAGWAVDQWKGLLVFPNILDLSNNYKILGNTVDTLTVEGPVNTGAVAAGDTFAIVYSKLIPNELTTPNTGVRDVKFFDYTGPNSFADGDMVYNGICEVCHTKTTHHRNDGTGPDQSHNDEADCTNCHPHSEGFMPSCSSCHGFPPIVDTATGGPDGLVNYPAVTGSATAGAHELHATESGYNYPCDTCHYGGMPVTPITGDDKIQIGFDTFGIDVVHSTAYDGQDLNIPYEGTLNTIVTTNGSLLCSNIYCHSNARVLALGIDDPSQSPPWNGPTDPDPGDPTTKCDNCHGYPPRLDLHPFHAKDGIDNCSICHWATTTDGQTITSKVKHVNGQYDVFPSPRINIGPIRYDNDFQYVFEPNGGRCWNVSCHQFFDVSAPNPAKWGYL